MTRKLGSSRTAIAFGLFTVGLIGACASLGTPEDQSDGAALWKEMGNYRSWGHFQGHAGMEKGKSPHGKYIMTYINDSTAAQPDSPPPGSIVVKENFSSEDPGSLGALTVMKRIEGYDPDNGDWFWARFEPSGKLTHSGKVSMCADCHFDAGGDDFLFLND